ncbi:glycosyltransferase [Pontibacter pamirensis]|uniref:glycosyltransferase n=1 Tax=Pontibacter pamirensis TaxID=2562824 RepID=UPI001389511F|nr:glycosyltransferase [Pontibacter pamirensis]
MRIVHIVECFAAGTAHFINLLTQYTSCEHIVIHGERSDEIKAEAVKAKFPNGVTFIRWKSVQRELKPMRDLKALIELHNILSKIDNIDVIHLHSSKAGFLGRITCFLMRRQNVIYTPNGASFSRADISATKKSLFIALERIADKLSGRVVCCSSSESKSFNEIGIKSTYINNGTSIPALLPEKPNTSKMGSDSETFTIVTVGRVTEQKNPTLFNKIANFFVEQKNIQFIWVGEGEAKQKKLLEAENIRLTGWLPKEEVDNIVHHADVYLSTSLWEGLPFSVLEAISIGKCVLLSDCVGNVDLVKDGFNGFIFDTAEKAITKIQWLTENKENIPLMENNSREWSMRDFDIKVVSKKYEELYSSLVSANTPYVVSSSV